MAEETEPVKVEVFAILCAKCKRMEIAVHAAKEEMPDVPIEIERKTDVFELKQRGVMTNPALIIDGEIVAQGNVPSVEEIKEMIKIAQVRKASKKD